MPDTQNLKISQFTFEQVEQRLQTIKFDQPADHFLNGEGNYVQVNATGGSQYDDTDIKNSIGTLTDLTTDEQGSLVGAVNELNTEKADKATDLVGYGITDAYSKTEVDDAIKTVDDKVGDTTTLSTTIKDNLTNAINELFTDKVDKTDLDDLATETFVIEKINEAQLAGGAQAPDLSIYQTKDQIGELTDLTTTEKDTVIGAINEVKTLVDGKANAGTTLAEYGITDAYTKTETDSEIQTKVAEAISNANHLKREIVANVPTDVVEENVVYMYKVGTAKGSDLYQEWMLIDGTPTIIGDTSTDLTDYVKTETLDNHEQDTDIHVTTDEKQKWTDKQNAITGVKGQFVGFDDDGKPIATDIEFEKDMYKVEALPEGSVVDYREKEIRIMCPSTATWTLQQVGVGGDPNRYYITLKSYAPEGAVKFKKAYKENFEDSDIIQEMAGSDRVGQDASGRKFLYSWITAAIHNPDDGSWTYQGKNSTVDNYNGVYQSVEFYDGNDILLGSDCIRINFSNEENHGNIKPFYASGLGGNSADEVLQVKCTTVEAVETITVTNIDKTFAEMKAVFDNGHTVELIDDKGMVFRPLMYNSTGGIGFVNSIVTKSVDQTPLLRTAMIMVMSDDTTQGTIQNNAFLTVDDVNISKERAWSSSKTNEELEKKQDEITGAENQIVTINADGKAMAIDGSVIESIDYTPSDVDGGTNKLSITLSDGTVEEFDILNGSKGDKGDKGDTGSAGATGTRGSRWNTGTAITGTSTTATVFSSSGITDALVNDMYLNTSTGYIYRCSTAGNASTAKWVYVGSLKGATGATGTNGTTPTIKVAAGSNINTVGTPSVSASTSGTTTTFTFNNLKGATGSTGTRGSRWSTGTAITGTSTTGTVFSGTGITDALVNDMYLNTSTGNVYRCTTAGNASTAKWVYTGSIKGASASSSVPDVAWATPSKNGMSTGGGISVSPFRYCVKNGICYVNGVASYNDPINGHIVLGTGLPKPSEDIYAPIPFRTQNSYGTPYALVLKEGSMRIVYPVAGEAMFFNFSYPVVSL